MHTTSLCHSLRLVARSLVRPPPPSRSSLRATKRTVTRNAHTAVCFASGSTVRYLRAWPRWTELWAKSSHSRVLPLLSTAYVTDPTTQPPHTLGPNREPTLAPRRTLFVAIRQRRVALWLAFAGSTLTLRHLSPRDSSNAAVLLPVTHWNCEWLWCSLTRRRHTPAGVGFFHAVRATVYAIRDCLLRRSYFPRRVILTTKRFDIAVGSGLENFQIIFGSLSLVFLRYF